MRVLICGGSGMIGRALTEELARDGHQVVILTRRLSSDSFLLGVKSILWDGRSVGDWKGELEKADAVINLAGASIASWPWSENRLKLIRDSRVFAGRALAEAISAARHKPRVLIQASAVGYYGPRGEGELDESSSPGSDRLARICLDWEKSTESVEPIGVRRAVIRTGLVLARRGGLLPVISIPFKFFLGARLGSGRQFMPWIHLFDEIAAIRFIIENEKVGGTYNLASPGVVDNTEFSRALASQLNKPCWFAVSSWEVDIILGKMGTLLLDGQRVVPTRLIKAGFKFRYENLEAALDEILHVKSS